MTKTFLLVLLPCALGVETARASALLKPTSGVTQALTPKSLKIDARLRGAFAQTTVTTTYSNPNPTQIEADFLYSAPQGSVVTGFAYWYRNEKVVARVVEKGRAAKIYQYITSRMRDPALVEMVGPNKFRARIFPVEANEDLKIEVRLAQTLGANKDGQVWSWPMREETSGGALKEVSVHLQSDRAFRSNLGNVQNNELKFERTNFQASGNANALVPQNAAPLRASLVAARDGGTDGFFSLALTSNTPVAFPRASISGLSTYDVLVPTMKKLDANGNFVIMGRYRGSGKAVVALNGRSVQVDFPDVQETSNLPSLLWGAGRIESLSSQDKNKAAVMALSRRFGVPSRWTSWLAIPEEERRNFRRQMWASDRADAAKAYAQAVSRGDGGQMKTQKAVFDDLTQKLKADGSNYAEQEELQPLSSYLNDELRSLRKASVQAKYDSKISRTQRAQWAVWAKNLQKAGATDGGKGVDLPVYVIEDELRIASRLYLQEIEAGHKSGSKARGYQARLRELAKTKTAQQYGWDETSFLEEQAEMRVNALSMEIKAARSGSRPDKLRERQARARIIRLGTTDFVDADATLQEVYSGQIDPIAQKWAREIEAGRGSGEAARKLSREVKALQRETDIRNVDAVNQAWTKLAQATGKRFTAAIQKEGVGGASTRALDGQVKGIAAQSGRPTADLQKEAWQTVANDVAQQLSQQIRQDGDETLATTALQNQLQAISRAHKIDVSYQVRDAWNALADESESKLEAQIRAGQENSPEAKAAQKRIETAQKKTGQTRSHYALRYAWTYRSGQIADQVIKKAVDDGQLPSGDSPLRKQGEQYAIKGGNNFDQILVQQASSELTKLQSQIAVEVAAKRENGSQIGALRSRLEQTQKLFPKATSQGWSSDLGPSSEEFAWEGRAHEAAYKLLETQKSDPSNSSEIADLQHELDESARKGSKDRDAVVEWEKGRLARNEPLITASNYRLRSGDPLISVVAPANCREVVAQMPDGSLLPLRYNVLNRAWEARFDVPTFALDGDYRVQIFIVSAKGERHHLTMNFAVDSRAPQGTGTVRADGRVWHLSLKSDEHTDRVSAFLPWKERVNLRRDENANFVADVNVPADFTGTQAQVRFLLTDRAHNKTEVLVDLNN